MKQLNKTGKLSTSMVNTAILAIVLLTVLFQLYAQLVPEAQTAGDTLNAYISKNNFNMAEQEYHLEVCLQALE